MWHYGIGSKPPIKKQKTEAAKNVRDTAYDNDRRTRVFQQQWLQLFPWLEYDSKLVKMFCSLCRNSKNVDPSVFITGSSNFKIDSIKAHALSIGHVNEMRIKENLLKAPGTSQASKALLSLQECQKGRLLNLFRTAHALAKNSRPFSDFVWQCKLDLAKNVNIGQSYQTDKACKEFTSFIAKACLQQLVSDINETRCFSLMCDESTDSAIIEQLIIYVTFCHKGKVSIKFLSLCSLNKPDAESIFIALKNACMNLLKLSSNPFEKLLCFAADGAATMQGCKTGVGTRISVEQPNIIKLHCMAHRLELAFKCTLKSFKVYYNVEEFLLKLYLFYHNSPANRAQLKEACKSLKIKELVLTRVGGTRWLPHLNRALSNLWSIFDAIILQLENCSLSSKTNSGYVAIGLLNSITSEELIYGALELSEVVYCLQKVSLTLQDRKTTLFHAYNCVSAVIESINDLKDDNEKIKKRMSILQPKLKNVKKRLGNHDENTFGQFIDQLIQQLKSRYPDMSDNLISASKLLSLSEWPPKPYPEKFGKEEIRALIDEYNDVLQNLNIQTTEIEIEWISLKKSLYYSSVEPSKLTWEEINAQYHVGHSNILGLIDILHSIPCTSIRIRNCRFRIK